MNRKGSAVVLVTVFAVNFLSLGYLFQVIDLIFAMVFHGIESAIVTNLLKLFFTFLILIFPTTIIGSIFPITTYLYSFETGKLGKDVAFIYFLDTFGAAPGALISGFILVP